ncbi:MAG: proton-conducting transporter membrane subunit [Parasphingorhabdus sp.]|uniref:proton-conducting transporter transmembrane domain-containing protein n=1 Tax=Parasphingorhabdus sp. TaxID=2709688 RepID=UPI0030018F1A
MDFSFLPWLTMLLVLIAATFGALQRQRGGMALGVSQGFIFSSFILALGSAALLVMSGNITSSAPGILGYGLSIRIDSVSIIMLLLVSFIGWIVVRYSATYLDGEKGQNRFTLWLCLTLFAVMMLVVAGNLIQLVIAWVATSHFLHRLLLFYPERPGAQRAARKKFLIARMADLALSVAAILLFVQYRTFDIGQILTLARTDDTNWTTTGVAVLLAFAAILKSAQFPFHGWLTEVMEAPTPVSALLHAGVINGGGFLLIRFADVMLLSPGVMATLVMIGGFTALFGGLVMLTQPAVKTSLAWSTIAQMGFMILQCGLALFPFALLHIVAHSLYKAHSFLNAGSSVEMVTSVRRPGLIAIADAAAVARAFLLALAIYAGIGLIMGLGGKSPQAIALGAILVFGVAYLLAQGLADAAPKALMRRTIIYSLAATASYFLLQSASVWVTSDILPATPAPGPLQWALIMLALFSFGAVAVVQAMFPLWALHPAAAGLRVHLSNGFYINAIFDRMLGNWSSRKYSSNKE